MTTLEIWLLVLLVLVAAFICGLYWLASTRL